MKIEYEATYLNIEKKEIRSRLKKVGATLVQKEFLMKREVFDLPSGHKLPGGFLRVRDEGNKITLSLKIVKGGKISSQRETCFVINNFKEGTELLSALGCRRKAYQETKRELWLLDDVEITIDEWPYLEPYVEVEGRSEAAVKKVSQKLGFDYKKALFCSADALYQKKYGVSRHFINFELDRLTFKDPNPFLKICLKN